MLTYLLCIIFGIILYLLWNKNDNFSVGGLLIRTKINNKPSKYVLFIDGDGNLVLEDRNYPIQDDFTRVFLDLNQDQHNFLSNLIKSDSEKIQRYIKEKQNIMELIQIDEFIYESTDLPRDVIEAIYRTQGYIQHDIETDNNYHIGTYQIFDDITYEWTDRYSYKTVFADYPEELDETNAPESIEIVQYQEIKSTLSHDFDRIHEDSVDGNLEDILDEITDDMEALTINEEVESTFQELLAKHAKIPLGISNEKNKQLLLNMLKLKLYEIYENYKTKIQNYMLYMRKQNLCASRLKNSRTIQRSFVNKDILKLLSCELKILNNIKYKNLLRLGWLDAGGTLEINIYGGFITIDNLLNSFTDTLLAHFNNLILLSAEDDESDESVYHQLMDINDILDIIINTLLLGVPPEIIRKCLDFMFRNYVGHENIIFLDYGDYPVEINSYFMIFFMFFQQEIDFNQYMDMFRRIIIEYITNNGATAFTPATINGILIDITTIDFDTVTFEFPIFNLDIFNPRQFDIRIIIDEVYYNLQDFAVGALGNQDFPVFHILSFFISELIILWYRNNIPPEEELDEESSPPSDDGDDDSRQPPSKKRCIGASGNPERQ